jgi:hypothetical protein
MLDAMVLIGEETEVDDVRLSPDDTLLSHEKWEQESEQITVKDDEAAAETGTKLEDSIKKQQQLPGYDASPAQSSDGISYSEDEMTNVDKSSVEKDSFEQEINYVYLKFGPEKLQEKIRQLQQQVQKGLDEAAQHQERADLAVAELLDAKKEIEAMKDEEEEANDKVSELTDRVLSQRGIIQSQRGIIDSLKSGMLQIDPKKGSVFLRLHIGALEAVLSEDRVSQEEDGSSPKIEQESSPVSLSEVLDNTYARKPARTCFKDYVDDDSSRADSSSTTTSEGDVIWFFTEEATTAAAQIEISERYEDYFEEVDINENESELSEHKSLSEFMSAPAQSPRSVVLKEFSEKKLPAGTVSQDLILEAAMKKQTTWTGLGGFFS